MKSKLELVLDIIQKEPNYETFEYKGFHCVVKRMMYMGGQLNGYVRIMADHKYYDKSYADIDDIECHGGLTFSGDLDGEKGFYIGFDTAHYQDYMPFLQMNLSSAARGDNPNEHYRDIEYVRNECKSIVDQLLK